MAAPFASPLPAAAAQHHLRTAFDLAWVAPVPQEGRSHCVRDAAGSARLSRSIAQEYEKMLAKMD